MSNFTKNWVTMGYTLLFIAALVCWPITLCLGIAYLTAKTFKIL